MTIRLLGDRILIKPEEPNTTTKSGLLVVSKDAPGRGTVVSVGPGTYSPKGEFIPTSVVAGNIVLFSKNTGETIEVEGEKLLVLTEGLIMGVVS
jgi:chaperonin GroES